VSERISEHLMALALPLAEVSVEPVAAPNALGPLPVPPYVRDWRR
jgi:hypothetical protein